MRFKFLFAAILIAQESSSCFIRPWGHMLPKYYSSCRALSTPTRLAARTYSKVLFTPRNDIKSALISLINMESESVKMAGFLLTDGDIIRALVDAKVVRNVDVVLVLDHRAMQHSKTNMGFLRDKGIRVFDCRYGCGTVATPMGQHHLMHHKFIHFGRGQKALVWFGSYNFTKAASRYHCEDATITNDPEVIKEFDVCFHGLQNLVLQQNASEVLLAAFVERKEKDRHEQMKMREAQKMSTQENNDVK